MHKIMDFSVDKTLEVHQYDLFALRMDAYEIEPLDPPAERTIKLNQQTDKIVEIYDK